MQSANMCIHKCEKENLESIFVIKMLIIQTIQQRHHLTKKYEFSFIFLVLHVLFNKLLSKQLFFLRVNLFVRQIFKLNGPSSYCFCRLPNDYDIHRIDSNEVTINNYQNNTHTWLVDCSETSMVQLRCFRFYLSESEIDINHKILDVV